MKAKHHVGFILFLCVISLQAKASTLLPFSVFNKNPDPGYKVTLELTVESGKAHFRFINDSELKIASKVHAIFLEQGFEDLGLTAPELTYNGDDVKFKEVSNNGTVPSPNDIPDHRWEGHWKKWKFDGGRNKLTSGKWLNIAFDYAGTEAELIDAITDISGNSRIALHDGQCALEGSCSAAVSVSAIPIPMPLWLLGSGILGLFVYRRQQKNIPS